jgi:hypothetical protein
MEEGAWIVCRQHNEMILKPVELGQKDDPDFVVQRRRAKC